MMYFHNFFCYSVRKNFALTTKATYLLNDFKKVHINKTCFTHEPYRNDEGTCQLHVQVEASRGEPDSGGQLQDAVVPHRHRRTA